MKKTILILLIIISSFYLNGCLGIENGTETIIGDNVSKVKEDGVYWYKFGIKCAYKNEIGTTLGVTASSIVYINTADFSDITDEIKGNIKTEFKNSTFYVKLKDSFYEKDFKLLNYIMTLKFDGFYDNSFSIIKEINEKDKIMYFGKVNPNSTYYFNLKIKDNSNEKKQYMVTLNRQIISYDKNGTPVITPISNSYFTDDTGTLKFFDPLFSQSSDIITDNFKNIYEIVAIDKNGNKTSMIGNYRAVPATKLIVNSMYPDSNKTTKELIIDNNFINGDITFKYYILDYNGFIVPYNYGEASLVLYGSNLLNGKVKETKMFFSKSKTTTEIKIPANSINNFSTIYGMSFFKKNPASAFGIINSNFKKERNVFNIILDNSNTMNSFSIPTSLEEYSSRSETFSYSISSDKIVFSTSVDKGNYSINYLMVNYDKAISALLYNSGIKINTKDILFPQDILTLEQNGTKNIKIFLLMQNTDTQIITLIPIYTQI